MLAAYAANLKGDIVSVTGGAVLGMVVNMMYLSQFYPVGTIIVYSFLKNLDQGFNLFVFCG